MNLNYLSKKEILLLLHAKLSKVQYFVFVLAPSEKGWESVCVGGGGGGGGALLTLWREEGIPGVIPD
jgi:hypothetical protein